MKRWNGWGDEAIDYPLPQSALKYLEQKLGPGSSFTDAAREKVLQRVTASRLPGHPLVTTDPLKRLLHSAGHSLGDWINLRGGMVPSFPDGVAYPLDDEDVRQVLDFAQKAGAIVIPYGGGTSVVGHLSAPEGEQPVLTVDLGRMNGLIELDQDNHLAEFQAGVRGPDLEAALRVQGFTLGHYPQSFEYSTLGGWVATRSAGQFSLGYGRIEHLFAGGIVHTPEDKLELPPFPASAAGPDLRDFILGSEGKVGIISRAVVRVTPVPEKETFLAAFFSGPDQAIAAVRTLARSSIPLAMLRLSLPEETATNLALAGSGRLIDLLNRYLVFRGAGEAKCMLLYGAVGSRKEVKRSLRLASRIIKEYKGVPVGAMPGREWQKNRFRVPYLRNTLWEKGYAVDTLETATTWRRVEQTVKEVETALRNGLKENGEKVHVFTHLSHVYPQGSSIYTTYLFRISANPAETMRRWQVLKKAASQAIVRCRGTISHQHGVGLDHRAYLGAEKGTLGLELIRSVCKAADPAGIMNPGKLVP